MAGRLYLVTAGPGALHRLPHRRRPRRRPVRPPPRPGCVHTHTHTHTHTHALLAREPAAAPTPPRPPGKWLCGHDGGGCVDKGASGLVHHQTEERAGGPLEHADKELLLLLCYYHYYCYYYHTALLSNSGPGGVRGAPLPKVVCYYYYYYCYYYYCYCYCYRIISLKLYNNSGPAGARGAPLTKDFYHHYIITMLIK